MDFSLILLIIIIIINLLRLLGGNSRKDIKLPPTFDGALPLIGIAHKLVGDSKRKYIPNNYYCIFGSIQCLERRYLKNQSHNRLIINIIFFRPSLWLVFVFNSNLTSILIFDNLCVSQYLDLHCLFRVMYVM